MSLLTNVVAAAETFADRCRRNDRRRSVQIACISVAGSRRDTLQMWLRNRIVCLPILRHPNGPIFVSLADTTTHLGAGGLGIGHRSEWFALHGIPSDMITSVT